MQKSNKFAIAGWVLSGLLAAFLIIASGMGKFTQWEGKAEMFAKMGWTEEVMFTIGIVEVAIAVLFLIPQTAFVAAILLTGYLGGAVATHVRVDDPFFFPILIGVLVWVALGLRQPVIFRLAIGQSSANTSVVDES
ncbi:DoxX family protein [Bremerella cremea]|nr:DoxX family protein [Bremerella cremea]